MATQKFEPFTGKLDAPTEYEEFNGSLDGEAPKPASAMRKMADLGLGFASGAVGATKALTDVAGAGNKASKVLADLNTGINDYLSPEAKADQQEQGRIMSDAGGNGVWDGVKAGAKAFAVAPVQTAVQGLGSVVPLVAGAALTGGAAPAAAVGAGMGVAMGAGTAKGAIYDEIKKRGGTEEQAIRAQEYGGSNTDQIALGGALGVVDALTGVSKAASGVVRGALGKPVAQAATQAAERGIVSRAGMGMLGEMPLEAAQGGQEQVAANLAAQRAGYEAGTWDNVASNATLEALASAGPGAMFGAMDTGNKQTPPPPPPPAPQPDQPAPPAGLLGNTPDPLISFPDGTVGRRSEVDAYVAGLPENEQPAARARLMGLAPQPVVPEPVAPSVQMGIDPAAGVISKVAAQAVDTGTVQEIQLNQAADEERMAYEQAMADQDQANAEQDSVDKPITSGPIAESQMSEEDKRAVLFSNQAVADGGRRHVGTQDGDILNGMGAPFATRMAAARRANMEGKDWTIAPVFDGFVARRKDAFNGASDGVRGASAGSSEQGSDQSAPGVGLGATDGNGMGADARGLADDAVGESRQSAGGVDDTAVGRPGYDTPVEIDARVLQGLYEESKGEQLVNKPEKLEAWRNGTSKTDPSKFPVEIGFRDSDGGLDVNDGRHRIALAAERGEKVRAFIDGKDAEKLNALVNNVQNTTPAANESQAPAVPAVPAGNEKGEKGSSKGESGSSKLPAEQAPAAVASDAAPTEGVPGAGSSPVESAGVEQAWADAPIENLHALIRQKKASAAQMRRNSKAAKLESERAAWLEQAKATEGFVSQLQAVVSARENPIIQPEKQEQPTSALPEQLSNPEQKDNEVSQSAQPGAPGQGAGASQPTQTAPKTAKAGSKVGPASLGSAKADMDHLFGVDKKRAKAIERIAKGTAYFGTNLKAAQFIKENGLKDTHEVVRHESGANRWDVREKAPVKDSLPVQSERETRIASALASGGHVVGFDLRDRTGMRLMGLTPEEFATIPADKVRAKPSAEAARTDSTTKGNEDGTQAPETQQAEAQQSQERTSGQPVAAEKPSLKKAQAERKAKKEAEKTSDEGLTSAQYQMRHVGAKAFADGSKRVPPSFMAAASQREWLAGWDTANAAAPVASKPEIVVDKAEMRPYRKPDGSVGYEAVPIAEGKPAEPAKPYRPSKEASQAWNAALERYALANYRESGPEQRVAFGEGYMRAFDGVASDPNAKHIAAHIDGVLFFERTANDKPLDASKPSPAPESKPDTTGTSANTAPAATETVAKPDAKAALSDREKAAKAKMFNALGKLAHLAGKNTRMNWTQEEEQQLLPIVIELFDGAMELGAVSFQQAVAYVRDFITTNLDSETADAIPFDTLQGAYISVAGRHKDKPVTSKKEVVGYESLEELALAKPASSADTPTEDTPNEPANPNQQDPQALEPVPAAENRGPESSGRVERGSAGRRARHKPDDSGLAEPGVSGTRSGGSGSTSVRAPAPRAGKRGRLGDTGTGANGSAVPEAGSTQPVDLFSAPTEPVSAGNIQATNFRITEDLRLGQGGEAEKFRDNLAAIRTLKAIESEGRRATSAEQRTLARYVGWGGLASAFQNPESKAWKDDWKARGAELRELLTDKEYDLARRSTLDSHYTSQTVVTAMWDAARRLGFKGGLAAETSMGIGNFMGLMPEDVAGNTRFVGVEYDSLTARMAGLLYPQATVLHSGLQKVPMPDGAFDLNIGNPPFGDQSLRFQFKPEINRVSIHNQFFLVGVDALKPGGLQINVVSRYLLDAMDKTTRTMLAKKAKLVAAIRLPDTAFKENARTSVVTDIVILQRLTPAEESNMQAVFQAAASKPEKQHDKEQERKALAAQVPAWVEVATVPDPLGGAAIPVNSYFAANPGNILGTLERSGKMQFKNDITVRPGAGDLSELLAKAVARLPEGIMQRDQDAIQASIARHQGLSDALRISLFGQEAGSIAITPDGGLEQVIERETPEGDYELAKRAITPQSPWSESLYQDATGAWYTIEAKLDAEGKPEKVMKNGKATNLNVYERKVFASEADIPEGMLLGQAKFDRLAKLVKLRDLMVNQISLETEDAPTLRMEGNRKKLAAAYKDFVGTEGFISKPANSALVANMPDGALVQALELSYRKAISLAQAKKMGEKARPEQADPAPILTERVIPKYEPPTKASTPADALSIVMSEAGRVDIERMASLLGKTEAEVTAEMFDNADKPLIFKDPETSQWVTRNEYLTGQVKKKLHAAQAAGLQKHIAELEAVQPEPWGAENVTVLLGATFVPPQIYADFILHMTGAPAKVSFSQVTNSYSVSQSGNATAAKIDEWGAEGISIANMISAMLNSTDIKVTTTDSDGNTVVDKERTELANLKARQIASEFTDWAFADGQRRKTLVGLFNEKYNTRVNRQHDGSHLTLPGKVPDAIISMRRHQKNAIWRGISERFMLLDHVVGAGKTFTAIARAMERRRMGLSRKPAIIVPNHMVEQFTSDVYRLYPGAKVLAAGKADFEKKRRRKVFAKIASGDWDVVIIPHSSFGFIGIAPETEERYLEQELVIAEQAIKDAWEESDDAPGGRRTPFNVKQAERLRDKITARMEGLKGKDRKDRLLTFEQMGIDDLTVDEAHEFKNLFYSSRLTNVKGMGNPSGSQKAFDLYSKVRVLRESPTGTVTFMTGTPISNSAVEMFTMMRYLAADELRELGLEHFDAWRSQFVSTDAGWEPTETGRLKKVNRLGRSWSNMRSLMDLYYSFTDSVGNEDIKKAYAEDNKGKQLPIPKVKGGDRQSVVVQPTPEQVTLLTDTMNEFDALPGIQDPYERNIARLKLMDRARKLSLDVRAAVPGHPSKEVGGKLDKISDEVKRIYDQWSDDKGTQLIFLDRSVPKSKGDDKIIKDYDALVLERNKAISANDEEALRKATESLDKFDSNEVEELRASQAGGWNAYQQIKDNLIARGIPAGEIRFVQEANNDAQKQALFDQVKAGEVRVLIGSTPRMGAGTNVQDRLVALHHADVTWKPSDIEQREGRVIRQGNKLLDKYGIDNFEVEILAYATERTIDAKMWSLNSSKLKTINAIRNYDGSFSMDFDDDDSVSMAELAALASGNPMLLERVKLDSEINNLELLRKQHQRKTWGYVSRLEDAEKAIERATPDSERFTKLADQATIGATELAEDLAARSVTVEGESFTSYAEAAKAVTAEIVKQQAGDDKAKFSVKVGERRLTSQNGALDALSDALGDADPFLATVNGATYRGRTALAREVARLATDAAPNLTVGDSKVLATGKMLGFTFESSLSRSQYGGDYMVDMALVDADGKTVDAVTGRGQADTKFVTSSLTNPLGKLSDSINPERFKSRARGAVQDAERAKRELPELREKAALPFSKEGELDEKRARLSQVIAELSTDNAPASPEAAPEGDTPAMSRARPVFSRGAQVQANESVETIAMAIASKWEGSPEIVVAFDMDDPIIPEKVRKEDQRQRSGGATGTPEGFYYKGVVYLMSSKLGTPNDVARVLFHEALGHAGLRGAFGGSLEPILREVSVMRRAEVDAKLKQYGLKGINKIDRLIAAEEVLAEIAQTRPDIGFVKRAIAAIRTWMRQNVPGFNSLRLTDDELIRNYILPARRFVENGGGPKGGVRVEPTFSRGKDGKSSVLSKHGFFNAWPKFNSWTRAEYNDVVSLLPQEYRSDAHRAEPLSPKDRDTHTAAALSEIKSLNQSIGDKGFGVDSLGNLVGDMRNGITTGDLLRAADIADVNGLGVFVTGVKTDSIQVLLDAGFVSEFGIGGVLARVTKSNNPVRPMASGVMNNTAYGTMMSYKPKGFAAPMFSRSIGETLTTAANNVHDVTLPAGYTVGDLLKSAPGKVSWWHKTVGTMYNLAERSPQFKRVFDGVQNFINDVSYYATEAADLAPNILPKLETWKDIGKSPLSAEDTKAISAPIFEGTLTWARDEQGKPIKIEALEAQAATLTPEQKAQRLLRNDKVSDQVLKMWQGLPLDQYKSIIEGKYEREMLKAGVVWTDAELRAMFNLTDKQIPLYREFRAATDKSLTNLAISDMLRFGGKDVEPIRNRVLSTDNVVQAGDMLRDYLLEMSDMDPARKDVLIDTANKMIEKADKAQDLIARGYAPLSRYGQFTLDVVDRDGERVYFGMFESKMDASRMARKMELEYPGATITRGTVSEEEYKLFAGVSPETLELFGDMLGLEAQGDSAASKAFQTYLKLAKSNRSSMKRMIQRKGISGFSEDSGRVLAGFVYSNARQTASNLHMGEMTDAANEVAKTQGELKDQAVRLVDYVKNPREEAQAFRGLLFAQYIGGSVASAMVNMTQPLTMTFPWLSQYTSVADAAKQMTAAMKDANRKLTGDTRLDAALKRAEEDGTVSPQEVHQLMQQSQGRGALRSGDGTKAGDVMAAANNALSRFSLGWGKLFSLAEQFNRRATFIAAYRTAVAKGIDAPEAFARKAIAETQGIYNKGNKPNWARGAVGSTLFTFKQYSIAYVEMLHRMATQGGPEGKKAAMLALAVLFLMSGAGGMPGGDDLDDLISGIMQRLGYNYDSKTKRQEFFASIVGEGGAQFLERGVSGLPGVPIDVSGRLGMGNLIPGTGLLVKKIDHTRDLAEIAGPGGDFVKRGFDATGKVLDGNVFGANGAAATVAPKAIQNLYQSYDMATMGMYRDAKGMKVLDTGATDSVLKAIGFQPNDVKKVQDASFETQRMIGLNKLRETEIANRWALGIFEKDSDKVKAAREELAQWNATNPESPIRINFKQILQRVQKMNQTKAERITATAPKEIRADVRRALDVQ